MTAATPFRGEKPEAHGMERSAVFSPDGQYRYRLSRRWGPGAALPFILLNPSTAGAELDDPTVRRCIGFARQLGFNALELVNLFAFRSTDPKSLRRAGYPIGQENDAHLEAVCRGAPMAICGWGANARILVRPEVVLAMLKAWECRPMALQINAGGVPAHPLYLAYGRPLLEL